MPGGAGSDVALRAEFKTLVLACAISPVAVNDADFLAKYFRVGGPAAGCTALSLAMQSVYSVQGAEVAPEPQFSEDTARAKHRAFGLPAQAASIIKSALSTVDVRAAYAAYLKSGCGDMYVGADGEATLTGGSATAAEHAEALAGLAAADAAAAPAGDSSSDGEDSDDDDDDDDVAAGALVENGVGLPFLVPRTYAGHAPK